MFDNAGTPTNRKEILATESSAFTVALDKTKAYTCLFWADDNVTFNAAKLKEISLNADKDVTEAYFAKVTVDKGKNPAVAVTLKRAVAKITLTETLTVNTSDDLKLKLTNIYPTFNVLDGEASGAVVNWEKTINPSATTGTIATLYFFAKTDEAILSDLTFTYAKETPKTVSNIPVQQNHATNIKGEFYLFAGRLTVTTNDAWDTPDNEEVFPGPMVGDFFYSDKTYSSTLDDTKSCIGIVYVVNPDGKTGKVVSLDEIASIWSTENIETHADSETNGAENTAKILKLSSYIADSNTYPAFAWCAEKNKTAPAGIKWYIPAIEELKALYGKYDETGMNVDYSVKTAVNTSLSKASGEQLDYLYCSSSEYDKDPMYAWLVIFISGYVEYYSKPGTCYFRVVSAF